MNASMIHDYAKYCFVLSVVDALFVPPGSPARLRCRRRFDLLLSAGAVVWQLQRGCWY